MCGMNQRSARLIDAVNTTVAIGVFVFAAVVAVIDGLTGHWELALVFTIVAMINLQSLRMLRNAIKQRQESEARMVRLDAFIAAHYKRDDA